MSEKDDIEDLKFQLSGTVGELELALSRNQTLLSEQEDYRLGAANLHAEIAFITAERDEARRECCRHMAHGVMSAKDYAKYLNWDCYRENDK